MDSKSLKGKFSKRVKRVLLIFIVVIVFVWWISPIPEGTIILSLLLGSAGISFGLDWRYTLIMSIVGGVAGFLINRKFHLFEKFVKLLGWEGIIRRLRRKKEVVV